MLVQLNTPDSIRIGPVRQAAFQRILRDAAPAVVRRVQAVRRRGLARGTDAASRAGHDPTAGLWRLHLAAAGGAQRP